MKVSLGEKCKDSIQNIRGLISGAISLDKKISRRIIAKIKVKRILDKIIINNDTIDIDSLVSFINSIVVGKGGKLDSKIAVKHRSLLMKALYSTILKRLRDGYISPDIIEKTVSDRIDTEFFSKVKKAKKEFYKKYHREPPGFVLVSPTKKCNLACKGCYSNSTSKSDQALDYDMFEKIIADAHASWGIRSVAVSGGEPFIYKSHEKSIIDIACEFPYLYFQIYSNGTLITKEVAQKIAASANITPVISIEGYSKETNYRRGAGVHDKTLEAIQNLREVGVPFGVSITATRNNIDTLLEEKFYDYLFDELKITYGWIFEYMPMGRGADIDLMPTPAQRKELFLVLDKQNKKGRFICDFWSTSPASEGCFAAGRTSGYVHVNYNGNISPCAFNPFSDTNLIEVYSKGGNIAEAVENSQLLKLMRQWQKNYGFQKGEETGNLMTPCPVRDHFSQYVKMVKKASATPVADDCFIDINDPILVRKFNEYDAKLKQELDPVWEKRFKK
jgi:MoaA/NifB/PqqE/SkfB family radical SAM enzyme